MLDPDLAHLSQISYTDLEMRGDLEKGYFVHHMHRFPSVQSRGCLSMYKRSRKGKLWLLFDIAVLSLIAGLVVLAVVLAKAQ
jgi:hypothetical protein